MKWTGYYWLKKRDVKHRYNQLLLEFLSNWCIVGRYVAQPKEELVVQEGG